VTDSPTTSLVRDSDRPADALRTAAVAVSARSVSKTFRLPHEKYTTVRDRVLHPFSPRSYAPLTALRDVSFEVAEGEFFGVVGKNGSGKSTLLKCLANIYRVDSGQVQVEGRVAPFIELGVGFTPEMTARENVVANAIMLGLSPRQARERVDEIIAFAELQDFVDLKLKNFSSGMTVRLAFSVTVQVDADVVIFDEVLAVGDESFQRKCLARFDGLKAAGRTVLLVTHDMETVERICDRAMLLHEGQVVDLGDPATVAREYRELNRRGGLRVPPQLQPAVKPPPARPKRLAPAGGAGSIAFGGGLRRVTTLTRELAVSEFRLRYLDSRLSYLWAVMRPLAYFGVVYLFVTQVARFNNGVAHYPAYLLSAIVLWTYFDQSVSNSVHSLVQREPVLRKVPIPHVTIPLSVVLAALFDLCVNLVAVVIVLLASGVTPRLSWLELPLLIAVLSVLAAGVAMLLSALYVRFRDIDQIWLVISQALFFGTPIFYVVAKLPPGGRHLALANPLATVFTQLRHALIDPGAPTAAAAIGGGVRLAIPLGIVAGILVLGLWVFSRESPWVAENL
jgi:ABC-type polysaccharide/polyol phosphate transport system ATPase subunit/ABC-type polysaccharide/polyol phosphate export permease